MGAGVTGMCVGVLVTAVVTTSPTGGKWTGACVGHLRLLQPEESSAS